MLEISGKTNLLEQNAYKYSLQDVAEPNLQRDIYTQGMVPKVPFNHRRVPMNMPEEIWITDTSLRDGQQSVEPYTVEQIVNIYKYLSRLGGPYGIIRQTEFFIYSKKDREALEKCMELGLKFPEITTWIRATKEDFRLVRDLGIRETGILVSCSDYHIFKKMKMTRRQAMDYYLATVADAFEAGVVPRCHLEDITRADFYGFVVPFVNELQKLSRQAGIPVKIRACDTMGYGIPYTEAALPRSVAGIIYGLQQYSDVPSECLEWHGHNDFYKAVVNASTAWLYGACAVNCSLLGIGERTGNTPLEALVIEYISLTGNDAAADTTVITEIADYFSKELHYHIPNNYPFVGRDFNATSAGVHVDGLSKNEEIYNIFDTDRILARPVPIIITDKSGRAGVAYWLNHNLKLNGTEHEVSKRHPAVGKIYDAIMESYKNGRTTSYSYEEMEILAHRFMPELFTSEFDHMKQLAGELSAHLLIKLAEEESLLTYGKDACSRLNEFAKEYPFIQYLYLTDAQGKLKCSTITDPAYQEKYEALPIGYDFSDREWFKKPMATGDLNIMDVYQSRFTGKLVITVSCAVTDKDDNITGVLGCDIQLEQLLKRAQELELAQHEEQDRG